MLFVSLQLANSVTKPISKLQKLMKQAESGDLSVRFNSLYSDEIGDLGHSFNHMIHRIDHLIHRVYEEQQSKRDAELKSLQEQIKPHFLYNTLDTISWMARDYGADDIVRLVDALTSMFRIGLSHGKDFISVQEEITHVSNYLYIQKIRYKDKLNYAVDVPAELSGLPRAQADFAAARRKRHLPRHQAEAGRRHDRRHGADVGGGASHHRAGTTARACRPNASRRCGNSSKSRSTRWRRRASGSSTSRSASGCATGTATGISLDSTPGEGTTVTVSLPARAELINREVFHV